MVVLHIYHRSGAGHWGPHSDEAYLGVDQIAGFVSEVGKGSRVAG